jgi:DNA-binding NarL/FixJ family response regulator
VVRNQRPDVVLMDIRMPVMGGLEATRRIIADPDVDGTRIIVLTTFEADEYIHQALRGGRAASCPRTRRPTICWTASRSWPGATACCRPR